MQKKPAFLKYQVAAAALRKEIDHKDRGLVKIDSTASSQQKSGKS
jgi:hypothetical protein